MGGQSVSAARVTDRLAYPIFFRGSDDSGEIRPLRIGVYNITHRDLDSLCLFLVPRSRDPHTGFPRYEAVF